MGVCVSIGSRRPEVAVVAAIVELTVIPVVVAGEWNRKNETDG